MRESDLLTDLLVAASKLGARLWRNTSGFCTCRGRAIRYGVAAPGGSDLIGYLPVTITEAHVGQTLAVFVAVEAKTGKLRPTPEQAAFLRVIREHGAIAIVARSVEDLRL